MKRVSILLISICCLFNSIYSQEWTLDNCLSYAKENNKDLLSKFQNQNLAELDRKREKSKLLPQIDLSAGMDYYWKIPVQSYPGELVGQQAGTSAAIPIGTTWMGNYGINANWKLVDVETWQNIKLYSLKKQAAEASINSLYRILERNVAMAFYSTQIERNNTRIALKRYDGYKIVHDLIIKQLDQGFIDKISLNQSQNILNDYKEAYRKKNADAENSMIDLKFWMGYALDQTLSITDLDVLPLSNDLNYNESHLPDYEEQQRKISIARQQYKTVKSSFLPTLSLVGSYGQSGFADNIRSLKSSSSWYSSGFIGFRVSIPLVSLTNAYSAKREKLALNQTHLEFEAYKENKEKVFIQESIRMNRTWKTIQSQQEQLQLAEENEQLSFQRIEKGIIDMIQLKQIQQELIDAQQQYSSCKWIISNCMSN